jgi:hypothetical protein
MKLLNTYTRNGKWGYLDRETGRVLIPARYEAVSPSAKEMEHDADLQNTIYDFVMVKQNGKWGLRSVSDKKLTDFAYDDFKQGCFCYQVIVKIGNKWGVVEQDGDLIIPVIYDAIEVYDNHYITTKWGKQGVCFSDGELAVSPRYDAVKPGPDYIVLTKNSKKGALADSGKHLLFPFKYEDIMPCSFNCIGIKQNRRWQLVTRQMKPLTTDEYDDIKTFMLGAPKTVGLRRNRKWLLTGFDGRRVTDMEFNEIDAHYTDFLIGKIDGKYGVIDQTGKVFVPFIYDKVDIQRIEMVELRNHAKAGIYNPEIRAMVPPEYDDVKIEPDFRFIYGKDGIKGEYIYESSRYIKVQINRKWGVIDRKTGEMIIPCMYDMVFPDDSDIFPAWLNRNECGYINHKNEAVIPFIYDCTYSFNGEGIALAGYEGRFRFINRQGENIFQFDMDDWNMDGFENGLARVSIGGRKVDIDRNGKVVEYGFGDKEKALDRVFILERCRSVKKLSKDGKRFVPLSYPFEAHNDTIGYYASLEQAEDGMLEYLHKYWTNNYMRNECLDTYCFFIHEQKVDTNAGSRFESHRSYNPDGLFADSCLLSETVVEGGGNRLEPFTGRKPEDIRFKKGDIVEDSSFDGKVVLGIVIDIPWSPENVKEIYKHQKDKGLLLKNKETGDYDILFTDYSDDCYTVIFPDDHKTLFSHDHPAGWHLFPPRLCVPKKLKNRLEAFYRHYVSDKL